MDVENQLLGMYAPNPPLNLKPPQCITCMLLMLPHVCMWYILVVLGSVMVLSIEILVTNELVEFEKIIN